MPTARTVLCVVAIVAVMISSVAAASSSGTTITVSTKASTGGGSSSSSSSSSSSGGSTGGGVIVNEPLSNVLNTDRKEKDLRAGSTATYLFNLDIYKIELHPTNNEDSVMVRVDELKAISSKTPTSPNAEVYKYFNVYSGTQRINGATIYFTASADNARLVRWNTVTKAWDSLETSKIDTTHYSASTSGFSNFAIVKSIAEPQQSEPLPTQSVTQPEPQQTAEPVPQELPTQTPTLTIPGFGLIGALLIVFVIYRIKKGN